MRLNSVATVTVTDMASRVATDQEVKGLMGPPSMDCPTAELNHVAAAAAVEGVEVFYSAVTTAVVGTAAAAEVVHSSDRT